MPVVEVVLQQKGPRRRDSESTPTYSLPAFRPFQLCTLTDGIPVGTNWLFEMKFDGYRAQLALSGENVAIDSQGRTSDHKVGTLHGGSNPRDPF